MSFNWYIDIEESTYSQQDFSTGLPMGKAAASAFSVGPIEFEDGQNITVEGLVEKINRAFTAAFQEGTSPHKYFIEARLRPINTSMGAKISQASVSKINTATNNRELAVEYRIFNNDNIGFALQFRSGPHGTITSLQPQYEIPAASVTVKNDPDVVGIIAPYCQLEATIADKPPVPPDLVFVPYVGVNNKIMVLFNSNAGEKEEYPVLLRSTDIAFILEEYLAQHQIQLRVDEALKLKAIGEHKKLQYRNDDPIRKYELFRVDSRPTSYDSFRGYQLTAAPIQAQLGPDKFSTAVAYVDTIVPNTKYWYCARSLDIHQNISNPTYIFEIEMVDNKGQMFMRQKVVTFEAERYNYKKTGRRFLAIEPRFEQMTYDEAAEQPGVVSLNEAPTSNILGSAGVRQVSSVWGKNFKVRVTSKKTGRKIDLNIAFKNTGVVIP